MNIAHITWEFPPVIYGGLGTFASEITQRQVKQGDRVAVFTLNANNDLKIYEQWRGVDVYRPKMLNLTDVYRLFSDPELKSWGSNFKFFADVINYNTMSAELIVNKLAGEKGQRFDVIDAHDWLGVLAGITIKKELNVPLMFHIHSTEIGRSHGRGSHTVKDIEFEGGQIADGIITVSYSMKDELEKLGFPAHRIHVCWNGVDTDKYNPGNVDETERKQLRKKYDIDDNENMLFFVGRLVTVKGVDNLIRAMPKVLDEFPNTKLVILGVGEMIDELKKMTEKLGVAHHVVFRCEFISEYERIVHYAASDLVVLPSIYEPFGIVCTEAMSMGKPTVVGAKGTSGFREQIIPYGEKQCGIHVNGFDPDDIAWGISQVLNLEDKGKKMGENARERAVEEFNWDKVVEKTNKIYKRYV